MARGDIVVDKVTIGEQLRAVSDDQIRHGMTVGPAFPTLRDLVLRHGRGYIAKPLPRGRWSRVPKSCFANALTAALTGQWVYVEGFATPKPGGTAILHAWLTSPESPTVAYDPTWKTGCEYFGIPFQVEYVVQTYEKTGAPGVLDAWELGWPLLCGKDCIADVTWKFKS